MTLLPFRDCLTGSSNRSREALIFLGFLRSAEYQPYWAARAELLGKIGANREAWHCYAVGIGLERDGAVRRFLQGRQSALPQ